MKTAHAVAAWIALLVVMVSCSLAVHFEHNLLFWRWQGFTLSTICLLSVYAACLITMVGVAPFARTRASRATMRTVLFLLALLGISVLQPEHVEEGPYPRTPSPLVYRRLHASALLVPVPLVWLKRRGFKKSSSDAA